MTRAGSSKEPGCLCPGRGRAERIVRGQGSRASYLQGGLQESNDGLGPHSLWSAADACFVGKQLADVEVNLRPGGKHNLDAGEVLRRLVGQPHYEGGGSHSACLSNCSHALLPSPSGSTGGKGGASGKGKRGNKQDAVSCQPLSTRELSNTGSPVDLALSPRKYLLYVVHTCPSTQIAPTPANKRCHTTTTLCVGRREVVRARTGRYTTDGLPRPQRHGVV